MKIMNRPNLGGLTRTSEIFAVKKLVVSSLKVKKEQVFTSVSWRMNGLMNRQV